MTGMICSAANLALLGLTPRERWSATSRLNSTPPSEYSGEGMLLTAVVVLMLLALLLWWVSSRRRGQDEHVPREFFAESANRRGLSARERQILLAIVVRSGLGQSEDIFTVVDAFDRGATKLREECSRTRTAEENERLETEIALLRGKLGFELTRSPRGSGPAKRPSSRDIPAGKIIELTRRQSDTSSIQAEVVRNDDIELAVELFQELDIHVGESWLARYDFGTSFWEFDTVVVRCEGTRLVLNHSDHARFVDRRRFPRVAIRVPALLARLPAMKKPGPGTADRISSGYESLILKPPVFVQGTVTEIAGPGLRIEAPMQAGAGDRLFVMFQLDDASIGSGRPVPPSAGGYVVSDISRVQYAKRTSDGVSMAVELGGLSEADVDGLVRFAYALQSRMKTGSDGSGSADSAAIESHAVAAKGAA
jgi:hypothetical protein